MDNLSAYRLSSAPLSNAGMLVLLEDEVEVKCEGDVSVIEHMNKKSGKVLLQSGLVVLTNLRIVSIVDDASSRGKIGWGLNLADVAFVEDCSSSYFGNSTRIHIQLHQKIEIGLKFLSKQSNKANFLEQMQHFLSKKSWVGITKSKSEVTALKPAAFSASTAGVAGILRNQEQNLKSNDALARDATADLDSLMKRAKEMATVVQRYASYAGERGDDSNSERSDTTSEAGEVTEIDAILQSMGIASPVTKFSAGRLYHQQLARQLADFLHESNRLSRLGGMMTLTDVYGIFNRARGTELVSPDDFLQSATMMGKLGVGISLKRFESGVIMLRLDSLNEEALCQSIVALAQSQDMDIEEEGIQASLVAQHFNLSIVIAKEILLLAESRGLLCRDDSIGGLAFFPNKFADF